MTQQQMRARNLGSNYTTFRYAGKAIAYLESISDQGQQPVAGAEFIHPLGSKYPTEIVTSRAMQGGTLVLGIREIWNQQVWEQMAGLAGTRDLVEVFERLAQQPNYVQCAKIITPPSGKPYGKLYQQCVITSVPDGEDITIETLSVVKSITVAYTYATRLN